MGKAFRKVQDIAFHVRVPEFKIVKGMHFLKGLFGRPTVEGDPVGGNEHAATVAAQPAMDKDFPSRAFANKREELCDLFVGRGRPTIARQIDETHAQRFGTLSLVLDHTVQLAPKINDCVDAEFLKVLDSVVARLGAAVQKIIHFAEVGYSGD